MKNIPSFTEFINESFTTENMSAVRIELEKLGFEEKPYDERLAYSKTFSGDISGDYIESVTAWMHPSNSSYGIIMSPLIYRTGGRPFVSNNAYGGFSIVDLNTKQIVFDKKSPKSFTSKTTDNFTKALQGAVDKILKNKKF